VCLTAVLVLDIISSDIISSGNDIVGITCYLCMCVCEDSQDSHFSLSWDRQREAAYTSCLRSWKPHALVAWGAVYITWMSILRTHRSLKAIFPPDVLWVGPILHFTRRWSTELKGSVLKKDPHWKVLFWKSNVKTRTFHQAPNMNLNPNSEGCVTVYVHGTFVDMCDHVVGLVLCHPWSCSPCTVSLIFFGVVK
jgi:hypothetical protein